MKVFTIEARAAAALGATTGKSLWIPVKGAKMVAFRGEATDGGTLNAFAAEALHYNGSAFPLAAVAGYGVGGGPITVTAAFFTGNAFNSAIGTVRGFVTPASPLLFFGCDYIRATYGSAAGIANFRLLAEVYYDGDDLPDGAPALVGQGTAT